MTKSKEKLQKIKNAIPEKFKYIHVDEFQDTNEIQYDLVTLLAGKDNSVFVVGDEDQCIYTWRGADISIILAFYIITIF